MNAIEHNAFTETLSGLSARLPRPKAVCVVSAHWVERRGAGDGVGAPEDDPRFLRISARAV